MSALLCGCGTASVSCAPISAVCLPIWCANTLVIFHVFFLETWHHVFFFHPTNRPSTLSRPLLSTKRVSRVRRYVLQCFGPTNVCVCPIPFRCCAWANHPDMYETIWSPLGELDFAPLISWLDRRRRRKASNCSRRRQSRSLPREIPVDIFLVRSDMLVAVIRCFSFFLFPRLGLGVDVANVGRCYVSTDAWWYRIQQRDDSFSVKGYSTTF
jgi:hypothetical protein